MDAGTYELLETEDGPAIRCRKCGLTSWNPRDVALRYCGHCGEFHGDVEPARKLAGGIEPGRAGPGAVR